MILILTFLLVLSLGWASPNQDSVYLDFKSEFSGVYGNVKLGDVALVQTKDAALKKVLEDLNVGQMPFSAEMSHQLAAKTVLYTDLSTIFPIDKIVLKGASKTVLKSKNQDLSIVEIMDKVKLQAYAFLKSQPDSITLEWPKEQKNLKILSGNYNINIRIPQNFAMTGGDRIYADVFQYDKLIKSLTIPVKIKRFSQVAILQKGIAKGEEIRAQDLMFEVREMNDSRNWIRKPQEVIGQKALRTLTSGRVLFSSDLEQPWLIEREQSVRIVHQMAGIRVEVDGISREKGRIGDLIRVQNKASNKVIKARVLSAGEVSVVL